MRCRKCKAENPANYLEVYNPETKRHKTVMLCAKCMTWTFELTESWEGQRCRREFAPDAAYSPRSIFCGSPP